MIVMRMEVSYTFAGGVREDVRTYGNRERRMIRKVYQYFQRKEACPCDECQNLFFDAQAQIKFMGKRPRWNMVQKYSFGCLFKERRKNF